MSLPILENNVKFLVDGRGKRTHAVLPIRQYKELLEDFYGNAVADSREGEGAVLKMQMSSKAYKDWLSSENDIYDGVFKGEG